MFRSYYAADYLRQLYKRGRKYGLCITGITQNVTDLLSTEMGKGMVGNSEFVMILNQYSEDLALLSTMLGISQEQKKYVVDADVGTGLLFAEGTLIPFSDKFPNSSYLYDLMSTKFGEKPACRNAGVNDKAAAIGTFAPAPSALPLRPQEEAVPTKGRDAAVTPIGPPHPGAALVTHPEKPCSGEAFARTETFKPVEGSDAADADAAGPSGGSSPVVADEADAIDAEVLADAVPGGEPCSEGVIDWGFVYADIAVDRISF